LESNSPKQPELFEQIESFISGLLRFVISFFVTIRDFMGRPRKFGSRVSETSGPYTRPYSFLTLSSFSLATIARYAIACVFLALTDMFRGCSKATQLPVHYPPASDLLKVPTLDDVIYLALPIVLLVIAFAHCVSWSVIKRAHSAAEGRRMAQLVIYASGIQFILIPVAAGLFYLATIRLGSQWFPSGHQTLWVILLSSPAVVWPAFCAYRAAMVLKPRCVFRVSHRLFEGAFVASVCVVSLAATLVASIGISYLRAEKDVKGADDDAPIISAAYLYLRPIGDSLEMAVIARNNSDTDLWLETDKINLFGKAWGKSRIVDADIHGGVLRLPSGKDVVIPLRIEAGTENEGSNAIDRSSLWFAAFTFSSVDHKGHWQQVRVEPEPSQEVDDNKLEAALEAIQLRLRTANGSLPNPTP
jgi:hypothetical protein